MTTAEEMVKRPRDRVAAHRGARERVEWVDDGVVENPTRGGEVLGRDGNGAAIETVRTVVNFERGEVEGQVGRWERGAAFVGGGVGAALTRGAHHAVRVDDVGLKQEEEDEEEDEEDGKDGRG